MESAPIDPPSDEHVLSGELLKSQHAGVRRLPHCAQITKRLISKGGGGEGPEIGGLDSKEREMKYGGMTERKGEVGIIFSMNYKLCVDRSPYRMCESFCFIFRALRIQMFHLALPSLLSLVKPRPNHMAPCVISQRCFWPPT